MVTLNSNSYELTIDSDFDFLFILKKLIFLCPCNNEITPNYEYDH